ncbi:MAG: class II fumarate hydratase [Sphingomonadales bacterium]|nr:class II fumarate hydratase [Sphingomonadales bacterium]
MAETRTENDSLGPIEVPAAAYWGAQTQRSLQNFAFGPEERLPPAIIHGLVRIKRAAAVVNALPPGVADAIVAAADEVLAGRHDDQFPLAIWQTGSGTQSNMNVNEVLAGRANEIMAGRRGGKAPVHPNDHVNRGQSSNDSFPTAIHVAVVLSLHDALLPALDRLAGAFAARRDEWADIVKIGRTHLQDATPLTLAQECSAWVRQLHDCRGRLVAAEPALLELAQGGTAVGTGLNAPPGFGAAIAAELARQTGHAFVAAPNPFAALAAHDALVHFAGVLATLAVALNKIANDLRLLGSGPRAGLGELHLPENEPGSSIMPGKVNPTQCEMLTMIAAQVLGECHAVTLGGMQGHLQLNVFKPLIGAALLRAMRLLARGMVGFAEHCVDGLEPDRARIAELVERSLMLVTALAPEIGYDAAAKIARHAHAHGQTLREAALELGLVDAATFDRLVRPETMTGPLAANR